MRSKSSGVESPANGVLGVPQGDHDISQEQEVGLPVKSLKAKVQQKEGEDNVEVEVISDKEKLLLDSPEAGDKRGDIMDLSKEDLLKLLGIMEGEVQAREDVICMLKSKQTVSEDLESRYGSAAPGSALQALQRDDFIAGREPQDPSVYQKPMVELDRLQEKHKETYRRMLGQLLLAEKCHRRTVHELDTEKRKHADYMNKSDDFTNLLEQERERSSSPQGRHPPRSYLLSSSHVDFSRSPVQVQFPLEWNYRRRSRLPPVPMRWLPVCKGNILYTLDNGNIIYIAPNMD